MDLLSNTKFLHIYACVFVFISQNYAILCSSIVVVVVVLTEKWTGISVTYIEVVVVSDTYGLLKKCSSWFQKKKDRKLKRGERMRKVGLIHTVN